MESRNVRCLITIPATDCNFISALQERATISEIKEAIKIMYGRPGNKSRIVACERELRRRQKVAVNTAAK